MWLAPYPRCDLTGWNQSVGQAKISSEGSGEENASRLIQVVGRFQPLAGLSLELWHQPTDSMSSGSLQRHLPRHPPCGPWRLFPSSGLIYERETASRTGKVTQMPISTFRALSKVIIWVFSSKNHLLVSQGKEGHLPYRNISGFSLDLRGKFYLLVLLNTTTTFFLQVWLIFKSS